MENASSSSSCFSSPCLLPIMAKQVMRSTVDNVNNLPDEVLSHIISFLPIKDAVRTSILSRRWRYLFTFISNLDLEFDAADHEEVIEFMNCVNRVFFFFEKLSIFRFRLKCHKGLLPSCIDGWIRALISRNVQELYICIKDEAFNGLSLPNSLFSCKTLVILKLDFPLQSYDIKVPKSVCLPTVKVFHLKGFAFSDNSSSERLFSGCPILGELVLQSCSLRGGCHIFTVSNSSVKRLTITGMGISQSLKIELVINAPRLIYFKHSFYEFYSYHFLNVESLTEAIIYPGGELRDSKIYRTATTCLLRELRNVHSLQIYSEILLGHPNFKLRVFMTPESRFFYKLSSLKILNGKIDMDSLISVLSCTDCVENLAFQELSDKYPYLYRYQLSMLWNHLKEINILSFGDKEAEMRLVEYFLQKAPALENLKLHITSTSQHSKIMKKLLMLPRASNRCRIVIV